MIMVMKKLIFILFIVEISFSQISFFVPEENQNFKVIDILYKCIQTLELKTEKLEIQLIDENIRTESLDIKEQYFRHQLKYKQVNVNDILKYFQTLKTLNNVKINYFNYLFSALEGNSRAKCFILLKSTRAALLQITNIISRFDTTESSVNKITYSSNEAHVLDEPSFLEKNLNFNEEEEYENPFHDKIIVEEKIDRDIED